DASRDKAVTGFDRYWAGCALRAGRTDAPNGQTRRFSVIRCAAIAEAMCQNRQERGPAYFSRACLTARAKQEAPEHNSPGLLLDREAGYVRQPQRSWTSPSLHLILWRMRQRCAIIVIINLRQISTHSPPQVGDPSPL